MNSRLVERDIELFKWLSKLHLLTSSMISFFFFGNKIKPARRRLQILAKNGYLSFIEKSNPYSRGRLERIYYLNKKSKNEVNHFIGGDTYYYAPPNNLSLVEHMLNINYFVLCLNHSCITTKDYSSQFFIEYESVQRNRDKASLLSIGDEGIRPDAMLILENKITGNKALFYLEIDMGNQSVLSLRNKRKDITSKIHSYKNFLITQKFKSLNEEFKSFKGFRVLYITTSESLTGPRFWYQLKLSGFLHRLLIRGPIQEME